MADDPRITVTEIAGRRRASSGARFEPAVGYSRAVRSGPFITVSGTVGLNADGSYPATAGEQARRALAIIRAAIEALGGRMEDVVRTRMFVTDMGAFDEVGEKAGYIQHEAGECYEYHYGGGGGWGDPLDRPARRVLDDVLDEYVSVEGARRDYGVVLTGDLWALTLAIDHEATARLRAEMRAARG